MNVCITSSSSVENPMYLDMARRYIQVFLNMNVHLFCGGVSSSMMKVIYDTFMKYKKIVTCYTLSCYHEEHICPDTILLDTTFDRTKKLYEEADLICVLPGGSGSLAELFSFLEESRTQISKPIILINENHFFDLILEHMHKLIEEGFNRKNIFDYISVVTNVEEMKKKVEEYYGNINNGKISESL